MLIKDIFTSKKTVISFEIFPPKKDYPVETIYETLDLLKDLTPDFISVTYGAGGSSKDRTVEIASAVKNKYQIECLAHLTCISSSKTEINTILNELKNNNISNIMALRGDLPQNQDFNFDNLEFKYAKELVKYISKTDNFCIGAAAYPEGHVECSDKEKDLLHLKEKVNQGVDFLITQLFFDNNYFYRFKENLEKINVNVPLCAGIMPVLNIKQIQRIVSLCGASIPSKLAKIIARYSDNPEALKQAGITYATEQIIDLISWGVDGIHIYTMNRPETTKEILKNISTI